MENKIMEVGDKNLQDWERGVALMEVLSSVKETKETYCSFLGGVSDRTEVFNIFNLKRFIKYAKDKNSLELGKFYWVKEEQVSAWEPALLTFEGLFTCGEEEELSLDDIYLIKTTPIEPPEDEEYEG